MSLVGRKTREGKYLVVWNGEILATYDTHAEQWHHVCYGYPAKTQKDAEKKAKDSAKLWSNIRNVGVIQ